MSFNDKKFKSTIIKCNNLSTLELDCISWKYLKTAIKDEKYLVNITNICIKQVTSYLTSKSHCLSSFLNQTR